MVICSFRPPNPTARKEHPMKLKDLEIGTHFVTVNEVSGATDRCPAYLTVFTKVSVHYSKNVVQKDGGDNIPVCRSGRYFQEMDGNTEVLPCKV